MVNILMRMADKQKADLDLVEHPCEYKKAEIHKQQLRLVRGDVVKLQVQHWWVAQILLEVVCLKASNVFMNHIHSKVGAVFEVSRVEITEVSNILNM